MSRIQRTRPVRAAARVVPPSGRPRSSAAPPAASKPAAMLILAGTGWLLSGCTGPFSTLSPSGSGATQVAGLFYVMITAAALVWLFVIGTAGYAARAEPGENSIRMGNRLIVFGGVLLPLFLLVPLSWWGFRQSNELFAPGDGLVVNVTGERFWWRVAYETPSGSVASANEIRMPVGERVEFRLQSADVIHSFWVPSLGGKIDMVPGSLNRLVLEAEREGTFRGACAEFCGLSHTLMEFDVVVMARDAFDRWLAREAAAALAPSTTLASRGQRLFLQNGCGACHRIGGTAADGTIGPDLTHVGSRQSIAAGTLPAEVGPIAGWISHPEAIKNGVLMPPYRMLDSDELVAIATYLESLE